MIAVFRRNFLELSRIAISCTTHRMQACSLLRFRIGHDKKPVAFTTQVWATFVGNNSYLILFVSIADSYRNVETTEIHDNFMQSI
jgi:hypothetical protein